MSTIRKLFVTLFLKQIGRRKSFSVSTLLPFVWTVFPYACFGIFILLAKGVLSTEMGMLTLGYMSGFAIAITLHALRINFVTVSSAIADVFWNYPSMKHALYSGAKEAWLDADEDEQPKKRNDNRPLLREVQ